MRWSKNRRASLRTLESIKQPLSETTHVPTNGITLVVRLRFSSDPMFRLTYISLVFSPQAKSKTKQKVLDNHD